MGLDAHNNAKFMSSLVENTGPFMCVQHEKYRHTHVTLEENIKENMVGTMPVATLNCVWHIKPYCH